MPARSASAGSRLETSVRPCGHLHSAAVRVSFGVKPGKMRGRAGTRARAMPLRKSGSTLTRKCKQRAQALERHGRLKVSGEESGKGSHELRCGASFKAGPCGRGCVAAAHGLLDGRCERAGGAAEHPGLAAERVAHELAQQLLHGCPAVSGPIPVPANAYPASVPALHGEDYHTDRTCGHVDLAFSAAGSRVQATSGRPLEPSKSSASLLWLSSV